MERFIQGVILITALLVLAGLATPAFAQGECAESYEIVRGDSLSKIAKRCGITLSSLLMANPQIKNPSRIYPGNTLQIPARPQPVSADSPTVVIRPEGEELSAEEMDRLEVDFEGWDRWIDVDLSSQTVSAYRGREAVRTFLVSSGTWRTPTVTGRYWIYHKYETDDMRGEDYFMEDVPYTMYFHKGYSLHGTYWHDNFGEPMSHGCVNLSVEDAKWMFDFASVGTLVNVHH